MNGLIDGYRDGGRDWFAGGERRGYCVVTIKSLSILCKALVSLVEKYSMKKVVLLAVAVQDWQTYLGESVFPPLHPQTEVTDGSTCCRRVLRLYSILGQY